MNEDEIAKIFQIDEGLGKVEMFNMNNNTLVKITIPEAREKELMRLDQTFIIVGKYVYSDLKSVDWI